jgi:hypothetical protein
MNLDGSDKERGLYCKFIVARVDPASQARHPNCNYFVLDLDHDPLALPAIAAYASEARKAGYLKLATDLELYLPDAPEFVSNQP